MCKEQFYFSDVCSYLHFFLSIRLSVLNSTQVSSKYSLVWDKALRRLRRWLNAEARPYQSFQISHLETCKSKVQASHFQLVQKAFLGLMYLNGHYLSFFGKIGILVRLQRLQNSSFSVHILKKIRKL